MKVEDHAKKYRVSFGEEFDAMMVHEWGHAAVPEPLDNHTSTEQDTTDYYLTHQLGKWERRVYKTVTGDTKHPCHRYAVLGTKDPSNVVPTGISLILDATPEFELSMDSARSAWYQYPTYNISYESGGPP